MPIYGIRTSSNNMTTSLCGTLKFSRYRVLGKIKIAEPGTGCHPGLMRNYLSPSVPDNTSSEVVFTMPLNRMDLETFQVHMRYLLLDNIAGYRSNFKFTRFMGIY